MTYGKGKHKRPPISAINVVPYIDVMLVLLVIFMITAPLFNQGVNVDLPKVSGQTLKRSGAEPIVVSVDAKGHYYLNDGIASHKKYIAPMALLNRVAALLAIAKTKGEVPLVLVQGDRRAGYGQVVSAMALLQKAGVSRVGLLTDNQHAVG